MSNRFSTAILVGVFSALSLGRTTAGQSGEPSPQEKSPPSAKTVPDHAVSGVVKAIDANRLVITRPRKTPVEMTFALSPSTQREGPVAVGAPVQVRFRKDGHTLVATAILATAHKRPNS